MGIIKWVKTAILNMDSNGIIPGFKINKQQKYKSLAAGLISLIFNMIILMYMTFGAVSVYQKQNISSTKNIHPLNFGDRIITTVKQSYFQFAAGFQQLQSGGMLNGQRIFDIFVYGHIKNKTKIYFMSELVPCDQANWKQMQTQRLQLTLFNISNKLCLPNDQYIASSQNIVFDVLVAPCRTWLNHSKPCKFKQFVQNMTKDLTFNFQFVYSNPEIIQDQLEPVIRTFQSFHLPFILSKDGLMLRNEKYIKIQPFLIQTNQNIFFNGIGFGSKNVKINSFGVYQPIATQFTIYSKNLYEYDNFIRIKFSINSRIWVYLRKLNTFLGLLMESGGIIAILAVLQPLLLLVNPLAGYDYNLQYLFVYDQKNNKQSLYKSQGFLWVLGYLIINWMKKSLDFHGGSQQHKELHDFTQSLDIQLDMRAVLMRMQFYEKALETILGKDQFNCLFLHFPNDIDKANDFVKKCQFRKFFKSRYKIRKLSSDSLEKKQQQAKSATQKQLRQNVQDIHDIYGEFFQVMSEQDVNRIDNQMRNSLLNLKELSEENDKLAIRILEGVDERIKKIYLKDFQGSIADKWMNHENSISDMHERTYRANQKTIGSARGSSSIILDKTQTRKMHIG